MPARVRHQAGETGQAPRFTPVAASVVAVALLLGGVTATSARADGGATTVPPAVISVPPVSGAQDAGTAAASAVPLPQVSEPPTLLPDPPPPTQSDTPNEPIFPQPGHCAPIPGYWLGPCWWVPDTPPPPTVAPETTSPAVPGWIPGLDSGSSLADIVQRVLQTLMSLISALLQGFTALR